MKKIFDSLRKSGLRITPLRKEIFSIYHKKKSPMTIPDLQNILGNNNFFPNTTTLYRQMETLVKKKFFQKISLSSERNHYELITHHHHHFTCTTCKQITCIDDQEIEKKIYSLEEKMKKKGFITLEHIFSLSGTCNTCTA